MQTPNACVVDGANAEPLPQYRRLLSMNLVKAHQWRYDEVTGFADLVPSVMIATAGGSPSAIEVIAHGAPTWHFGLGAQTVPLLAAALTTQGLAAPGAQVYLTGCNTGLRELGYCVADHLAQSLPGVVVHGAAGFVVAGCAALGNAEVVAEWEFTRYGAARNASHPDCWNSFSHAGGADSHQSLAATNALALVVEPRQLAQSWEESVPTEAPAIDLLIGPDATGLIETPMGPTEVEVLLKGRFVRATDQPGLRRVRDPEALWRAVRVARTR